MSAPKQLQQPAKPARRRVVLIGLGVLLAIVVVAVLGLGYATSRRTGTTRGARAAAVSVPGSSPAGPKLTVPDFTITPAPFVGRPRFVLSENIAKPTLVYFMASWCVSCVPEARAIAQLQTEMGQQVNFVVLDIDPGDNLNGLEHFWKAAYTPTNVWALDTGSQVTSAYHVTSLDTTIIIADGKEVSRTIGSRSASQLKDALAAVMGPQ